MTTHRNLPRSNLIDLTCRWYTNKLEYIILFATTIHKRMAGTMIARAIPTTNLTKSVPLGSESLKQRAYVELKSRILSGQLAPGSILSERQLAQELAMSKTPVHAALERLAGDGLVTVVPQQGIVVRTISPEGMADHFELREAIEPFVVSKIAGRLNRSQIQRLKKNLKENRRAIQSANFPENVRLDAEFHLLFCEFLGNLEILRVMIMVREQVQGVIRHISARSPERMEASLSEHELIAQAVLSGNGPIAAKRMGEHLRNGLLSVYSRRR
jgi:DNA-binding GntR family transcriptional regulator